MARHVAGAASAFSVLWVRLELPDYVALSFYAGLPLSGANESTAKQTISPGVAVL